MWHFAFYFCGVLLFTFVVMGKMSVPDLLPSSLSVFHKQRRAKGYLNLRLAYAYVWEWGGTVLLEQQLGHVVEGATPGEELVGGAFGDVGDGVVAGGLEAADGLVDAVGRFLAAAGEEDEVGLAAVLEVLGGIDAATQQTVGTERLGTGQGDVARLHAAHGEAGHGAVLLVGLRAEVAVDVGDEFIDENGFKLVPVEGVEATEAHLVGHAVGHDDDERYALAIGDEVVHDEIGVPLIAPGCLVLAPTVLEVEDRVLLLVLLVLRGRIDEGALDGAGALRGEENLLDLAVGHVIAESIEGSIVGGNFDAALPTAGTVVVVRTGVVEDATVDGDVVVVEAFVHGAFRGAPPEAVVTLREVGAATTAEAEADVHRLGIGCLYAEAGIAL